MGRASGGGGAAAGVWGVKLLHCVVLAAGVQAAIRPLILHCRNFKLSVADMTDGRALFRTTPSSLSNIRPGTLI